MPPPYLVEYTIWDYDQNPPPEVVGYGYKTADDFVLTAAHVSTNGTEINRIPLYYNSELLGQIIEGMAVPTSKALRIELPITGLFRKMRI